jgi:ATP-dependent DNA ligase
MNRFAALLDRLADERGRNAKLRLLKDYFHTTADPDRGYALAAITGALSFRYAKPGLIRTLVAERTDPTLFALSYDYVGDLSETVALMWPTKADDRKHPLPRLWERAGEEAGPHTQSKGPGSLPSPSPQAGKGEEQSAPANAIADASAISGPKKVPHTGSQTHGPTLSEVVTTLASLGKADLPAQLAAWLDGLDEVGRWALLKLVTGALRIGVSARLAKTAVAALGDRDVDEIEILWPSLKPPYGDLFAWLEGRAAKPESGDPAPFRPPMLSHAIEEADFAALDPADFVAEWKWDGIRVEAVAGRRPDGGIVRRLFSRTGEDISASFPDLVDAFTFEGALDGELLIMRDGRVQSFNVLQQRLNRKTVTAKLVAEFPAHLRAYDLLADGAVDLRGEAFTSRRAQLEAFVAKLDDARIDLSPQVAFASWEELAAARAEPSAAGLDAQAVEGVMVKRRDSLYLPGRPKGPWWKWKRDPFVVDAVLMYAQRGHGKRSSFYSDYTFGVWTTSPAGEELVPVGKAYFGFTDAELAEIDKFVRASTVNRFGPVREVIHAADRGLVFEVAFEGLQRSTRHRSGIAMRFPRISRLRWDKLPRDADRLEALEALLDHAQAGSKGTARRQARKVASRDVVE